MRSFVLVLALFGGAPVLGQRVAPTLELAEIQLVVSWVESQARMNQLRREYGQPPLEDPVFRTRLTGFSVLGKRDGKYVCLIFAKRPEKVDDDLTTVVAHELLHCLWGGYHE